MKNYSGLLLACMGALSAGGAARADLITTRTASAMDLSLPTGMWDAISNMRVGTISSLWGIQLPPTLILARL